VSKPNFFFIGAPKCGTTSIADFLSGHPNVFMSDTKEPNFFDKEFSLGSLSLEAYESLFSGAGPEHKVVGEASMGYLFWPSAVPAILSYAPDAKFLVSVRNPYQKAISLHAHLHARGIEDESDFSVAWKLQDRRRNGPRGRGWKNRRQMLLYEDRCAIGDQLERLYSLVAADRVCVVFFDDLKRDPKRLYERIYRFLGLRDDGRVDYPLSNRRRRIRGFSVINPILSSGRRIKRALGIYRSLGIASRIYEAASVLSPAEPVIATDVWEDMDRKFIPQIRKMEQICERDLSDWYGYRNER
jgi:hypothetical protein